MTLEVGVTDWLMVTIAVGHVALWVPRDAIMPSTWIFLLTSLDSILLENTGEYIG